MPTKNIFAGVSVRSSYKTCAKINKLFQTSILFDLKSVISTAIATLLLQIMCIFAIITEIVN